MLGKLSEPLQKFFGFLGASLTGITAVFTATGFLAERARLVMLGLPGTTFDLEQYLETGARFLALLPIFLGSAFLLTVLDVLRGLARLALRGGAGFWIPAVLLAGVLALALWRRRARPGPAGGRLSDGRTRARRLRDAAGALAARHRTGLLLLFLLLQFVGACQQTRAIGVRDLLFDSPASPAAQPADREAVFDAPQADYLERWIRTENAKRSVQYVGLLFLITLLTAAGLYRVARRREEQRSAPAGAPVEKTPTWEKGWAVASLLLLISQVTLLPVNYGILLSSNRLPEVCVFFAEAETGPRAELPPPNRLVLVYAANDGYYLYSRRLKTMWFVREADVRGLKHFGLVNVLDPDFSPRACLTG